MALGGQAVALDRVGEDHGRAGVVDGVERLAQRGEVVAAEVADRGVQGGVVEPGHELGELRRRRPGSRSRSWSGVQRSSRWYSGLAISSIRRRSASPPGRVEQLVQQPPVLDGEHLPARGVEHAREADGADVGHDPVEALPVEVDDPARPRRGPHHRVEDRLPAGALVQLGVADDRVLAARCRGAARSGAPAHPRSGRWRRCRPSRWSSRRCPGPSPGSGSSAARRTPAASPAAAPTARRAGS